MPSLRFQAAAAWSLSPSKKVWGKAVLVLLFWQQISLFQVNPCALSSSLRPNTDNPNFLSMARELFEREAKTLGRVGNHPQIPRLLDYFEDRQQFYLIQEFVKGNNLQQEVKKQGVLNEAQGRQVLKEVLVIFAGYSCSKGHTSRYQAR